jgi:vacuolar-type H+-ATPase subunit H
MHPDLGAIVSADEEARSRVALAEGRRERDVLAARTARDAAIDAQLKEASDALDRELQGIRAEGDARIVAMQRQQEQYLASLAAAGEREFDDAVALVLRMVCEVVR